MNLANLAPVSSLVQKYGVKAVIYGGPGTGKTPLLMSAPNPVICFTEPGVLSVRKWNGPGYIADTGPKIRDFWKWAIESHEARQFQTFCCDSISQMAEIFLEEARRSGDKKMNDGRAPYGFMSEEVMKIMNMIYFAPNFNAALVAKEQMTEIEGVNKARPYFPGNDLNIKVPHLFDFVWRIERHVQHGRVMRTKESFNAFARDRSGNLAEIEPCDISQLFNKSLQ